MHMSKVVSLLLVMPTKASFSPAFFVALWTVKDALCIVGSNVLRVPITLKLLRPVPNVCVCYEAEKEDKARKSKQEAAKLETVNQIADKEKI